MKVVIDIPDDFYKKVQDNYRLGNGDVVQIPIGCIANGTPLPKGHGRLKDVDALEVSTGTIDDWEMEDFVYLDEIDNAPTIIEAESEGKEWEK